MRSATWRGPSSTSMVRSTRVWLAWHSWRGGDLGAGEPLGGILGADVVQRVVQQNGMEPAELAELEILSQLLEIERRHPLEGEARHAFPRPLFDGNHQAQVLPLALDLGRADLG